MTVVRVCLSKELDTRDRTAIRALLDAAFHGEFSDDDWDHALGGTHALIEAADGVVAHASVVPRVLETGQQRVRAGYVEAVAVLPPLQGTGLGTAVMRALGAIIAGEFELGALSTGAHRFYERLGWERWQGPSYVSEAGSLTRTPDEDDGIMVLRFGASQVVDLGAPIACEGRAGDDW